MTFRGVPMPSFISSLRLDLLHIAQVLTRRHRHEATGTFRIGRCTVVVFSLLVGARRCSAVRCGAERSGATTRPKDFEEQPEQIKLWHALTNKTRKDTLQSLFTRGLLTTKCT